MRHLLTISSLLVAGCASTPRGQPVQPVQPQVRSDLLGMTAGELVQRFGTPALQIREGAGLKLQFRGRGCVLDAYLYSPPQGQGPERVTHVDARQRNGTDTDQARCISGLQGA